MSYHSGVALQDYQHDIGYMATMETMANNPDSELAEVYFVYFVEKITLL